MKKKIVYLFQSDLKELKKGWAKTEDLPNLTPLSGPLRKTKNMFDFCNNKCRQCKMLSKENSRKFLSEWAAF
jgi:hypothetical protein